MIKIGCNFLSLRHLPVEDFIRTCRDLNLDVVDFHQSAFNALQRDDLARIKDLCLRCGLPIGYIGVSGLFHGTAAERQAQLTTCRDAVELAAFLGSPIIRLFCGRMPRTHGDGEELWPAMIACYQEVADFAAASGIAVGLQNHPATGEDMLRIRRDTDRPNFHFIVDTGQWYGSPGSAPKGETDPDIDFYAFIEQTLPYAAYLRTKFYRIASGREEWLDYDRIAAMVKAVGYNGCVSIVYEGDAEDRVEQVRLAAAYLRTLLR